MCWEAPRSLAIMARKRSASGVSSGTGCDPSLSAGVVESMHGLEVSECDVGVDLGGGDVGVAEEGLNGTEVGSVLDHVGGTAVA